MNNQFGMGFIIYRDIDGNLHRNDGPAVIRPGEYEEYWIHGIYKKRKYIDDLMKLFEKDI